MFSNMLMTALTPLIDTNEISKWDNRPFIGKWPEQNKQVKEKEITKTIKKKPKRNRTAFTTDQLRLLEKTFHRHKYIDFDKRQQLAKFLHLEDKCIKVWFQNRRMKEKKELSESSDSSSESFPTSSSPDLVPELAEQIPELKEFTYTPAESTSLSNNAFGFQYEEPKYEFPTHNQWPQNYDDLNENCYQYEPYFYATDSVFDSNSTAYQTQYYPYNTNYIFNLDSQTNNYVQPNLENNWSDNYNYSTFLQFQ